MMQLPSGFKRYFVNTSWLLMGQVSGTAITLFVSIYVAKYLGPSNFGLLNYTMSFVALFSVIAVLGLDNIVVRELVKCEGKRDELLGTAFALKGIGAIILLGILAIVTRFAVEGGFERLLIFIIASAAVFRCFNVLAFYFQSRILSKYIVYAQTGSMVFSAIIRLLLIYFRLDLAYFAAVTVLESAALAIGLILMYARQNLSILHWRVSLNLAGTLLRDSFPLVLSGIAISVYMRIDQVMIKGMIGSEAVGNYAVAVKLSEAWGIFPVAITGSVFPAIVNARKVSEGLYHERLQRLYSLMTWLSIAIALPITFLAGNVTELLFGKQYLDAASVLRIYVWSLVFSSLGVASGKFLISENYTGISFFSTFIGMIVNVLLNIILIPGYGINGAAIATVLSYFIAVFFIGLIPKTRKQVVLMLRSVSPFGMIGYRWSKVTW